MAHVVSAYSRNTTRIVIDARKRDLDGKAGRTLVAQEPIVSTVLPTVCGWLFVTMRTDAVPDFVCILHSVSEKKIYLRCHLKKDRLGKE